MDERDIHNLKAQLSDQIKILNEIIKLDSIGNGQGYIKCGCLKGKCDNCTCKKRVCCEILVDVMGWRQIKIVRTWKIVRIKLI